MKVIVDDKIPFIKEAIEKIADEVVYAPGKDFTPSLVKDADALIIRTRTRCNRELLEGSKVKFIATATIGFDHIDAEYCREAGITWTNAPGCNSASVAQYLQSSLILLQALKGINFTGSYYRHYRSRQCRQQSCKSGTGIGDARFTERPSP